VFLRVASPNACLRTPGREHSKKSNAGMNVTLTITARRQRRRAHYCIRAKRANPACLNKFSGFTSGLHARVTPSHSVALDGGKPVSASARQALMGAAAGVDGKCPASARVGNPHGGGGGGGGRGVGALDLPRIYGEAFAQPDASFSNLVGPRVSSAECRLTGL
jgi:hypothetical protein